MNNRRFYSYTLDNMTGNHILTIIKDRQLTKWRWACSCGDVGDWQNAYSKVIADFLYLHKIIYDKV